MGSPITENDGKSRSEIGNRKRQDSASEEFTTLTGNLKLAPPAKRLSRAVTPDLFPDNMASRIPASTGAPLSPGLEDLSFDRMGSRIGSDGGSTAV